MYGLFGKFGSKEFPQKKGGAVHCEATHVCYVDDAREVTHVNTNVTGGTRVIVAE